MHCSPQDFYKMSLLFSIYLAVHYFGRNFCDIVHTANQLLHSANLQIFRSVPPCMHHIKFSKNIYDVICISFMNIAWLGNFHHRYKKLD